MSFENKNRFIDADELLQSIRDNGLLGSSYTCVEREADLINKIKRRAEKAIEVAPVKHGRWIPRDNVDWHEIFECNDECSECGFIVKARVKPFKFCPNCGATMDMKG